MRRSLKACFLYTRKIMKVLLNSIKQGIFVTTRSSSRDTLIRRQNSIDVAKPCLSPWQNLQFRAFLISSYVTSQLLAGRGAECSAKAFGSIQIDCFCAGSPSIHRQGSAGSGFRLKSMGSLRSFGSPANTPSHKSRASSAFSGSSGDFQSAHSKELDLFTWGR